MTAFNNIRARLHLVIACSPSEMEALAQKIRDRWLLADGSIDDTDCATVREYDDCPGVVVHIVTSDGFGLVPAIVEWAEKAGRKLVAIVPPSDDPPQPPSYADHPSAEFWQTVALAACCDEKQPMVKY